MISYSRLFLPVWIVAAISLAQAETDQPKWYNCEVHADLIYADAGPRELMIDLFVPAGIEKPPLLVFIHGGGWVSGSRKRFGMKWLIDHGFAVASIDYRLSKEATFPAQIHDCKAAVRWLRAHADEYGYDASRIAAIGVSAGGHLAMLLGVTGGVDELEGTVGDHPEQDSSVQAVVDYFGASDFILRAEHQPEKTDNSNGVVYRLLGGAVGKNPDLAKQASAAWHVTAEDPPLYILHGEKDTVVFPRQAVRMAEAYEDAGLDVIIEIIPEAGHGTKKMHTPERKAKIISFLKQHTQGDPSDASQKSP